jgi:hypothetical protein
MSLLAFIHFDSAGNFWDSSYSVPIAGCAMIACIVVASMASANRKRELQSQERLAAIAKGMPVPPTEEELAIMHGKPSADTTRRRGNTRRAGIVLIGCAVGLILFFITLSYVLQVREILSGAAAALIPFGIGVGFLVDARIQSRELEEAALNHQPPQH